jgi:polysaccharide biosynthesis transport protein
MELRRSRAVTSAPSSNLGVTVRDGGGWGSRVGSGTRHSGSEPVSDLHRYWQILRSRWVLVAATMLFVVAAVIVGTLLQTPVYRATGVIEIRTQDAAVVPVEALFQAERLSTQYLETQYGILRSTALAERVIADLGLLRNEEFNPNLKEPPPASAADSTALLAGVVGFFRESLLVDPITGSHLIRIHFESGDAELAARIVRSVIDRYREMRLEGGRAAAEQLNRELATVRDRLVAAEQDLQDYVRANQLLVVENGDGPAESIPNERLRHLQQELTEAEADRYTKESLYNFLQAEGDGLLDSEVLRSLNVRMADLSGEYARLRATFGDQYPRVIEANRELEEVGRQVAGERERIRGEISGNYFAAVRRETLLQQALDEQRMRIDELSDRTAEYRIRAREVDAHQQLYSELQQRVREAEVSAAFATTDVAVIDEAAAPLEPIRPVPQRNLQLALIVGLVLGLGVAFLREYTDLTVRSGDELDTLSVPLLGVIPSVSRSPLTAVPRLRPLQEWWRLPGGSDLEAAETLHWPRIDQSGPDETILRDAFGILRTEVLLEANAAAARSLLMTSAQPNEGKTTICVNLALSLAKLGRRVLLVDADLRQPSVHKTFGFSSSPGLIDVLEAGVGWRAVVHSNAAPGVDVLTAGRGMTEPSELLSSSRMRALIHEAQAAYDFVLVDSPALFLNAADTRILAPLVGGTVVVIRSGVTSREVVGKVLRQIPNLMGVVLNGLERTSFPASYQTVVDVGDQPIGAS